MHSRCDLWKSWLLGFFLVIAFGCSTSHTVVDQYQDLTSKDPSLAKSPETVIVFLIDGLSIPFLADAISSSHAPNIKNFFLESNSKDFPFARASFPTLT